MSWLSNLFSTPKPPPVVPPAPVPGVMAAPTPLATPNLTNPTAAVGTQFGLNQATLAGTQAATQIGQQNQYGGQQYQQTGTDQYGNPTYTLNAQLSPQQQALLDALQGTQSTAGQQAGNLLSGANYGGMSPADAIGDMSSGLEGTLIAKQMQQLAPVQESQRKNLDNQLRNQGLFPGNPAYDNEMRDFTNNINNANAANAAQFQKQAFDQSSQLYNMPALMAQSLAQFGAPADLSKTFSSTPQFNMGATDALGAYGANNSVLAQLFGTQTGANTANYATGQGALNNQYATQQGGINAQNQANMAQYQATLANQQNFLKGIFGLGGSVLGGPMGGATGNYLTSLFGNSGGAGGTQ